MFIESNKLQWFLKDGTFIIITTICTICQGSVTSVWCLHGFCDRALTLLSCHVFTWACGFERAQMPCFVLERGVQIPGTHVLSFGFLSGFVHSCSAFCLIVWVCGREFAPPRALLFTSVVFCIAHSSCFIGCVHSCYVWCCVARSLCISLAACFHVVMSCVNTWLMSILISCLFVSCFAHGWWFVLLAMCLCFCFVWAHGFCLSFLCAMCSHVNCLDPTHLVSWLLVHLPHLSSLFTLLICFLYLHLHLCI